MSDYEAILAEVQAQRAQRRPLLVRVAAVAGGSLAALLGLVLVLPVPEAGVPLLLVGLRLLAFQYEWAALRYAWLRWRWGIVKAWWKAKPRWIRETVIWGLIAAVIGLFYLLR